MTPADQASMEQALDLALDDAGIVRWSLDPVTGVMRHSDGAAGLYGDTAVVPVDRGALARLVHPDDLDGLQAALDAAVADGEPVNEEFRVRETESAVRWIGLHGRPVRDADGRILRVEGVATDRSVQRRAESALQESEAHFRALFEAMPVGIVLLDPRNGGMLAFNTRAHVMLGYARTEFARLSLADIDVQVSAEQIRRNLDMLSARPEPLVLETRLRCQDGQVRDVAVTGQRIVLGGRVLIYGVWQDIGERKRVEQEMNETRRRLRAILDNTSAIVCVTDRVGRIIDVNRSYEQLFGLPAQDLVGRRLEDLMNESEARVIRANDERVLAAGVQMVFEEQLRVGGALRTYLSVKAPLLDERDQPYAVCGIATDITAIKSAETALRDLDKRKDEFLAMLAHELRNPLAPLGNAAELMRCIESDDPALETVREIVERQVRHLARLVDDLMDVSRIHQGKVQLKRQPVDLRSVLAAAAEHARPMVTARAHVLDIDIDGPLPVTGDPTRLAQVFGNLLTNAAKYTPQGGHLLVEGRSGGGSCVVRISDDGIGIPRDLLPHIFDLFTQGDRGLDRAEGGLGIGLSVVRSLVELHGGRVAADSDGPGHGSSFTVWLPLREGAHDSGELPLLSRPSQVVRARRVLIVDDNADAADSLATLLALRGHLPQVAYNASGALQLLEKNHFDVMVLDIGLPGMDGYTLAQRIRSLPDHADTTLVALTGYGQPEDVKRAVEVGFDLHMTKPADLGVLESTLAQPPRERRSLART